PTLRPQLHGYGRRRPRRLSGDTLVQTAVRKTLHPRVVPLPQQLAELSQTQQRQLGHTSFRLGHTHRQQVLIVGEEPIHRGGIEQIGRVLRRTSQLPSPLLEGQRQIELRHRRRRHAEGPQTQTLHLRLSCEAFCSTNIAWNSGEWARL